ncbi:ZU5 domain-containing protein [Phthorimaea operculella]|nr:ZU5 domain-containing protein [Phthorimaea operculella]
MSYQPQQEVVVKSISRYSTSAAPEGYCYNVDPNVPKSVSQNYLIVHPPASVNGMSYQPQQEVVVKSISRYSTSAAPEGYCYNVDPNVPKSVSQLPDCPSTSVGERHVVPAAAGGGGEEHQPVQHQRRPGGVLLQRRPQRAQVSITKLPDCPSTSVGERHVVPAAAGGGGEEHQPVQHQRRPRGNSECNRLIIFLAHARYWIWYYRKKLLWKNFLVSFLVDARGGAMRGCRGGGVRVIVPPLSAQQPTRITCRYLKPSRINHMPPLMEGEALAARVLEMGPVSAKFLGPVILEVPHYASLRGKEREIVILRSDNGTSWREHNTDATDDMVQDILHETLEIEEPNEEEKGWDAPRLTRILTHDFPQYFAVISRIRQEVHAIGPEGGMVSSSVVPQVQAVFPQGALTKKIKVGLQAQIIDSELTAKLLGRGVAVSPVVTVEPRRRKFHKAITLSMPAPRPHTQGMTNQYSTSSAPTLRLLCSISGGTNRAHWEDVTENTPLTFVNDCVSFTTTVSARYWLIDCRHIEDATKMATELYREAIHVPFMSRLVVYAKRTDEHQAQLRMFCVTDDKEDKALERIERFIQVAKSRDVEVSTLITSIGRGVSLSQMTRKTRPWSARVVHTGHQEPRRRGEHSDNQYKQVSMAEEHQAQLRMFCVTDDKEDKALECIERFIQVAKSRDVEVSTLITSKNRCPCLRMFSVTDDKEDKALERIERFIQVAKSRDVEVSTLITSIGRASLLRRVSVTDDKEDKALERIERFIQVAKSRDVEVSSLMTSICRSSLLRRVSVTDDKEDKALERIERFVQVAKSRDVEVSTLITSINRSPRLRMLSVSNVEEDKALERIERFIQVAKSRDVEVSTLITRINWFLWLRMFCVTDDKEDKALERIERFIQVAKSRDVEVSFLITSTNRSRWLRVLSDTDYKEDKALERIERFIQVAKSHDVEVSTLITSINRFSRLRMFCVADDKEDKALERIEWFIHVANSWDVEVSTLITSINRSPCLRMFCVTDDKEDKALERIERFIQVAKSYRDVEVHEGKPIYLEFGGNLVPVAKSGEQLSIPFRAFRENRVAFPVMIKTQDLEPICRCQFMRDPKVPKGEPSPAPIAVLNIMVPDEIPMERASPLPNDTVPLRTAEQELIWRQRLSDPRLEDICNLLGKDWVALAYELGVSVATVNQIQAKRITAAEQAQLMLKLWKTQSGTKAQGMIYEPYVSVDTVNQIQAKRITAAEQAQLMLKLWKTQSGTKAQGMMYELCVSVDTVNQIQAKRITAAEQAQLMLKLWKTQSGTKAQDTTLELALCRIGRDDIIAPQSDVTNERRIQRNIYQERQASEEIEAYKAEEDNKLKEKLYEENQIAEHMRESEHDQDEAKYSPEEKSVVEKSEIERTPTPSEESEEDEDVKRSVAERKEQITKKLSKSKIPASKQKKEIREEIIEIKTQIKPDIKKLQQKSLEKEPKMERSRSKSSPESVEEEREVVERTEEVEVKKEEQKPAERPIEQFRKFDPSSPGKPTPKHLQRHMRNESMKFSSGDFSNVTITPRKSITAETTKVQQTVESKTETFTKEAISQKEIYTSKVEEKLDDGDRSPDLISEEERDIAEATLKDKISSFESKMSKEPSLELAKPTVKLTKEALKKHTMQQEHGAEYTQEFVRKQSEITARKTIEQVTQKVSLETENHVETAKTVKETIHQFDTKTKTEDKSKSYQKTMRTDSTLVQVSDDKKLKGRLDQEVFDKKPQFKPKDEPTEKPKSDKPKKPGDDDKKDESPVAIKVGKLEKQMTEELRSKVSEEELTEALEEKDVSVSEKMKDKVETQESVASVKSDLSRHTKTDSMGSDLQDLAGQKLSQESPIPSAIDKVDSMADLQQSTERDFSFVSQTDSKFYSKESKHRSDSLDEASQFSDLEDQLGTSPAQRPQLEKIPEPMIAKVEETVVSTVMDKSSRDQTLEFLKFESEFSSQTQASALPKEADKVSPKESPIISAKARQFIETVPEDDSVQECFFSKRIYSDSLEDSEQSDSRRHSEAESLKSDQSDVKAKVSSSDFDERAEYEETADSGSGFGDEKFEESVGFTSIKIDPKVFEDKQDSESDKEPDVVFKKMGPKRHSRSDSMSITKLSDLTDVEPPKPSAQEFQVIVTEAEEIDRSDKDEPSDKISSESSREVEISDRKSSEGISAGISSEDAVTDKKTSSEEEAAKEGDQLLEHGTEKDIAKITPKEIEKVDVKFVKEDTLEKVEVTKRQSVTSAGSGSVSELRLEEKRLSDAHSLTESRDYTFEESEDDIGTQGTHIESKKESKLETEKSKVVSKADALKLAKLTHGDSLDDVEGFPEDHVTDYVHKLPHIAEVGATSDKDITHDFLKRERNEQLKREAVQTTAASTESTPKEKSPVMYTKESETSYSVHRKEEPTVISKMSTTSTKDATMEQRTETRTETTISGTKFDVTKIRTDTLGQFDMGEKDDTKGTKRFVPKDLNLKEVPEITKEQVKPVIDDILHKGTIAAAARSPVLDKDIKKEVVETEKRSYDAKAPHKEERRYSCISPAISLEKIAESDVEDDEEEDKVTVPEPPKVTETKTVIKKSDSAMKQMADNIEIIIKQASEDFDASSEEHVVDQPITQDTQPKEIEGEVSIDSIIEEAVTKAEDFLEKETKEKEIESKKEIVYEESKKFVKERPGLIKSLSRDSGEIVIMPKKKHPRTFSVQSSPEEVEEQIYTDSESDMDKAKVLEIIEPSSDLDGKMPITSFDAKKMRTDSLDDADDFPEKEAEYFGDEGKYADDLPETFTAITSLKSEPLVTSIPSSSAPKQSSLDDSISTQKFGKQTHFVESVLQSDLVSKSTTESSVTTVVSTLTKSSDEEQKSVLEDATSADFSKISSADLAKDPSKTSMETKDDSHFDEGMEDRGTPDLSKKSLDLTKDYSKSSIDSKDTSRDFATNELSKDSTVDLTKDFSKASVESVRETSKSIDEKTFSEDQSSLEASKTLASDVSESIAAGREFVEDEKSASKIALISSSSQEKPKLTESQILSEQETFSKTSDKVDVEKDFIGEMEEQIAHLKSEFKKEEESLKDLSATSETGDLKDKEERDIDDEAPDMTELSRRCSNLLDDISQGAVIRIDSSHVTHELVSKFSRTPPPSPIDLIGKDKSKVEEGSSDKHTGLQLRGSEPSFLEASRQSPRASSAGDSLISETEAHQSEILTHASTELSAIARPKSPTKHLADNLSFINVDQPTLTTSASELVDRTIEKSIDVIGQIKQEQLAVKMEEMQRSTSADTFYSESHVETSTSSTSVHKIEGVAGSAELKFQSIDPRAMMSDMVAKFGGTDEFSTVLTHKETETKTISGQEYFTSKQVSSSDDDSLVIQTKTTHELRGQEREIKEKTIVKKEGDQTETSHKKLEKAHEAAAKRSDTETKTMFKSTDDTDIVKVEREFSEQGLYTGRQTKSEEKMTAIKDETIKKKHEIKISERDMSHDQWGKEYFTEPEEIEENAEEKDSTSRIAFVDSSLKIIEKDEVVSTVELSEKGKIVSSKIEHHKEESVIESKEHDDLSSDASHAPSFKSETADRRGSSEMSPKSKSKSFKKDNEVYEVDFIKEIKVSTSPVKSTFSRTGSQDTQSESEAAPELPHDGDTPKKDKLSKSPIKMPQQQIQDQVWEVSIQKADSFEMADDIPRIAKIKTTSESVTTKSSDSDTIMELRPVTETKIGESTKLTKTDMSPGTQETTEEISSPSKDIMLKSGESVDTECMVKSLESHEGEILQKSLDSTMSAETLHASEFSTEADSAFLTGTDHKKEEVKLVKEKSMEDICSSGYDTDLSSAEFHATKLETERVDFDSLMSAQPLADLSVLEKTIDEVKQSLEAAQGEIISEKNDGSSKYKQSPSEFQFKLLISPDRPEVITEEPHHTIDDHGDKTSILKDSGEKTDTQRSDSVSQKISSQEGTTTYSDEDRDTVFLMKESSPPLDAADISIRSDSGPHSILETESDIILSDQNGSSKGSPEVKLRVQKHIKSKLGVGDRRSASEVEGWSSSGSSHYHSFEQSEGRPLSSDVEVMMTAQSGTDFDTALTSHDVSSQSLRTSKDYYTAASSLASRDSMKSLDSDGSSHVASIDISDASETLVPSANELKEELMESSTYVEHFLHETDKPKVKDVSDDDVSADEEEHNEEGVELVGKMKRSHEMRFVPKDLIPDHFPIEGTTESIEVDDDSLKDKDGSDTTISSQFRTDEILSSSISKLDMSSSLSQLDLDKDEVKEQVVKASVKTEHAVPFAVTKIDKPKREFVDIESEIIPVGSTEYEEIVKHGGSSMDAKKTPKQETATITKTTVHFVESEPGKSELTEVKEECIQKVVKEVSVVPFPVTELPPSKREFVDIEADIIPIGSKQYEEILKSKSDSSVPKTKAEKSIEKITEPQLDSKPSSTSSLKTQEHLSTPQTPLSAPSQSSISTDNGREYVLDEIYDISETPELQQVTESSRSELLVTTEERHLHTYPKDQDSPTSDEFEMVDKPSEMDDFVVIEEVAKEAHELDPEGKSVKIKPVKFVQKHDTEVEEYLSKASKKQESTSSASTSLSDEELLQYELEQKRLQAQELAEIEAGKRWIQMQFEGDPRYDYERVPLEDIKEEEMTDFDASRIGSLSSQKESVGSYGSFRNSYGSLSESEMASRLRFRVRGENDDISISSLQEFENLERALMEQYGQQSSSSQDSLNGSLPRRYVLSKSQGDDISVSSLKEFEGLESACLEALKAEVLAKQKEALLQADPKVVSGSFLEQEKRSYGSGSDSSSPPQKSGSPSQKNGSPSQKSGSPSQKGGSPSQRVGSYGSPSQKLLADTMTIRKLIDQTMALEQKIQEQTCPRVITVRKYDDRGAFFVPEPEPATEQKSGEVLEDCKKKSSFVCAAAPSDGSAESIPGDCEEMMKLLEKEEKSTKDTAVTRTDDGVIEVVRTTTVIQQRFVDGKKVSETVSSMEGEGGVDIPARTIQYDEGPMSFGSEMSSSVASQPSELDSLTTVVERHSEGESFTVTKHTIITTSSDRPEDLDLSREGSAVREISVSPSSGRSITHSVISFSGKHFTDPASGSWSGQDEELSSSGSFSRGARADLMLGSTDSLEATSSNATRATYNYEVDTPMTGSLTSGGSNTMVSSLDTLDPVTAVQMESLEHQSTSEQCSHAYDVQEPDSDTERLELDGRQPKTKERTIMFDSTDTLSAVSGDGSVKEATVETPAMTFYIGDTPIPRGAQEEEEEPQQQLSGSCPASLPPASQASPPIPAQRRSLTMLAKSPPSSLDDTSKK